MTRFFGKWLNIDREIGICPAPIVRAAAIRPVIMPVRALAMTQRSLLASDAVFADMGTRVGPEAVAKVKGVFRFDITENKKVVKTWTADLKNGDGSLVEGEGTKPDVTITVADADFVKLAAGELDAQKGMKQAFKVETKVEQIRVEYKV